MGIPDRAAAEIMGNGEAWEEVDVQGVKPSKCEDCRHMCSDERKKTELLGPYVGAFCYQDELEQSIDDPCAVPVWCPLADADPELQACTADTKGGPDGLAGNVLLYSDERENRQDKHQLGDNTTIDQAIQSLQALKAEHGGNCHIGTFHGNEVRPCLRFHHMHRECRTTGKLFSGVIVTASKR